MSNHETTRLVISDGTKFPERMTVFGDVEKTLSLLGNLGYVASQRSGSIVDLDALPGEAQRVRNEIEAIEPPVAVSFNPGHGNGASGLDNLTEEDSIYHY